MFPSSFFNALVCPFNPVIIGTIAGIMSRNSHLKKEIRMRRLLISRGLNQDRTYIRTYARVFPRNIHGPLPNPILSFILEAGYSRSRITYVSLSFRQIEHFFMVLSYHIFRNIFIFSSCANKSTPS